MEAEEIMLLTVSIQRICSQETRIQIGRENFFFLFVGIYYFLNSTLVATAWREQAEPNDKKASSDGAGGEIDLAVVASIHLRAIAASLRSFTWMELAD